MGRPRKEIDIEKIVELSKQGVSTLQISKDMQISQPTIWRVLNSYSKRYSKLNFTSEKSKVIQNVIQNSKITHDDKAKVIQNSASSSVITTYNNSSSIEIDTEFYSGHHHGYKITYKGTITEGKAYPMGNKKNPYEARTIGADDKNSRVIMKITKDVVLIWVKKEVMAMFPSDAPEKLAKQAKRIALQELIELGKRNNLTYDESTFEQISQPHFVSEGLKIKADRQAKAITAPSDILLGDSSDKNEIEFIKEKGQERAKTLLWLLDELPKTIKTLALSETNSYENAEKLATTIDTLTKIVISNTRQITEIEYRLHNTQKDMMNLENGLRPRVKEN